MMAMILKSCPWTKNQFLNDNYASCKFAKICNDFYQLNKLFI